MESNKWMGSVLALSALIVGCATGGGGSPPAPPTTTSCMLPPSATNLFQEAMVEMAQLDRVPDGWTPEKCLAVAEMFLDAAAAHDRPFSEATYNAGVSHQRCNDLAAARKLYEQVLHDDPKFHRARVQLVRLELAGSGGQAVDTAIAELERAVQDSHFQNVEALVELARALMQRRGETPHADGSNDLERAKRNLQRALAVDDAFMPAFNQLALYYLERAKESAGDDSRTVSRGAAKKLDAQAIDLALLVASQAIRKDPNYAPIHNTAGLLYVYAGDLNSAVRRFDTARKLDGRFFEANMNFASVNMMFRGFAAAEGAYRAALTQRPGDYDAHLGLALALRAQIDAASDQDPKLSEAESLINKAKALDAKRPEAHFNHAILTHEFKARGGSDSVAALEEAIGHFREFVKRAQGRPELAAAVDDVLAVPTAEDRDCMGAKAKGTPGCKRGRIFDLQDEIAFLKESQTEQRRLAEEAKTRAALDEALSGGDLTPL
ncbi:MAG: hypothetical protein IPG04_06570 [Polyangiaceae bacterium]|nr:hypothetical protein [Polyangiaceae bacterium]